MKNKFEARCKSFQQNCKQFCWKKGPFSHPPEKSEPDLSLNQGFRFDFPAQGW